MSGHEALTPAMAAVRELFGAAACSCCVLDEAGAALVYVAAVGEGASEILGVELPVGRGIAGWAASSGQPIAVRDVREDPRFARDIAERTSYVPTSILAAPVFDTGGDVVGVLSVLDADVDAASDWTLAVLGTIATLVGGLLARPSQSRASSLEALGRQVLAAVAEHDARDLS